LEPNAAFCDRRYVFEQSPPMSIVAELAPLCAILLSLIDAILFVSSYCGGAYQFCAMY
jgi:hypothetical protein